MRSAEISTIVNKRNISPHPKGAAPPAGSGFKFMKQSITDVGLLLYYTSKDEIMKIDSTCLGDLIKKELQWMSGESEEPQFEDVRCDILHMHLKEQIKVREMGKQYMDEYRKRKTAERPEEPKAVDYPEAVEEANKATAELKETVADCNIEEQFDDSEFKSYDDVVEYLVNVQATEGKHERERQMNKICDDYGFDFFTTLNKFKEYSNA